MIYIIKKATKFVMYCALLVLAVAAFIFTSACLTLGLLKGEWRVAVGFGALTAVCAMLVRLALGLVMRGGR